MAFGEDRFPVSSSPAESGPGVPCIFGDGPAAGQFYLDHGCVGLRDRRVQDLCLHHINSATPIRGMALVYDYTADKVLSNG